MITEVFVSLNGLEYAKLDLENDESIPMRYTFKDTQDISKIFSPYSLNFTFIATPNNLISLGFFGNTEVLKPLDYRKLRCKVYVNSLLNQNGILKLEKITYKMGKPDIITASFTTNMASLKDKIGDDTIDMLGDKVISYTPLVIKDSLQAITSSDIQGVPIKYFIPLASTNRVLQYNGNGLGFDNIAFDPTKLPTSNNVIKGSELRPAISFSTVIELIKKKYGLLINAPLENLKEYKDAYIWCLSKNTLTSNLKSTFVLLTNLSSLKNRSEIRIENIPNPKKYTITSNTANNSFKIVRNNTDDKYTNFVTLVLTFENVVLMDSQSGPAVTISLNRIGSDEFFINETFDLTQGTVVCEIQIPDTFLLSNEIEFNIKTSFNTSAIWSNAKVEFNFKYYKQIRVFGIINRTQATFFYDSNLNNNNLSMGGGSINLINALPAIKVIDFLTSYFKAFNIAVLDVTPDDDSLYWYTPQDILANKKEVTYIANIEDVEKSSQDDFNYYILKHADSNFKSNVDYKTGSGNEYGQVNFPEIKPNDSKEYKVETNFTLIPPVGILGAADITTMYGFESGSPEILETGEARYTPNFGELVIFYSHGNKPLNKSFGVQSSLLYGGLITQEITSYIQVLPYTTDLKSFAFSVLVLNSLALRDNLFSRYYAAIIKRYVDQNVMKQSFSLTLNAEQIRDFRLENDIIIGENKFTIIDATIDITTGITKLELLNY